MEFTEVQKLTTYDQCYGYLNGDYAKEVTHVRSLFDKAKTYNKITQTKFGRTYEYTYYYDKDGNLLFKKCCSPKGKNVSYEMQSTDGKRLCFYDYDGDGNIDNLTKAGYQGENYWTVKDKDSNGEFDLGYVADGRRFSVFNLRLNINFKYY